jgi:hypothetical protein
VGWLEDKIETKLEHVGAAVALESQRTRAEMGAAFAKTQRGLVVQGALARSVVPNQVNVNAGGRLVGWSLKATGGPVTIVLHDGRDASTDAIAVIDLVDGENQTQWNGPGGVSFTEALYVEYTGTGSLVGALHLGAVD